MEETFKEAGSYIALGVEAIGCVVIAFGAVQAVIGLLRARTRATPTPFREYRRVWVKFGVWMLFGLEFELAADIVRSAISPSWRDIGQLAAIAAIRTVLNYFLERDMETMSRKDGEENTSAPEKKTAIKARSSAPDRRRGGLQRGEI